MPDVNGITDVVQLFRLQNPCVGWANGFYERTLCLAMDHVAISCSSKDLDRAKSESQFCARGMESVSDALVQSSASSLTTTKKKKQHKENE